MQTLEQRAGLSLGVDADRPQMNIVIVGHVDHGKSTLVGRLLADTGSIDPVKVAKLRARCAQQGKRFEYAFLLDALEAEQAQGITIDAARCFFQSARRDYLIIDAPGHIEFLKNMITGAARAEAAVLLIDAYEGVRENSRRHGYMLGLLGIKQVVVVVNKLDRVGYDPEVFQRIRDEYTAFLARIGLEPAAFVPVSALQGDNLVTPSANTRWYQGPTVLGAMDAFEQAPPAANLPLRMPVQDVYRFNQNDDHRRIIAGRVTAGALRVGDPVVFQPSGKRTRIASIEAFGAPTPPEAAQAGESIGVTMTEQIFVERGEIMCAERAPARVSNRIRANLFWLGQRPLTEGRTYKVKLGTYSGLAEVERIVEVMDASALSDAGHHDRVDRHEVAEVILRLRRPIACDLSHEAEDTGRLVLVDGYDLAGGGIVRGVLESGREDASHRWTQETGVVDRRLRETRNAHPAALIALYDDVDGHAADIAAAFEESLWRNGRQVYRLDLEPEDVTTPDPSSLELGSTPYAVVVSLLHAGQVVVATLPWSDNRSRTAALRLPGYDRVPLITVRMSEGETDDAAHWHLNANEADPRQARDRLVSRLEDVLGR